MKILYVVPDFYPINWWYANACTNFVNTFIKKESDKKLIIFTNTQLKNNKEIESNNITIIRKDYRNIILKWIFWQIESFFFLKKVIIKNKINLVYLESWEYWILWWLLHSIKWIKIAVRIHWAQETEIYFFKNNLYSKFQWFFTKKLFKNTKYIISTCPHYIKFIKQHLLKNNILDINNKNYFILPNFSSNKDLHYIDNKNTILNKYWISIPQSNKLFITLWRLNTDWLIQKWFEDLIKSIYFVKENICNSKFLLIWDWEKFDYLKEIIHNYQLNDFVYLIKKIEHNDLQIIQNNSINLLLSRFEWLSMFALEWLKNWSLLLYTKDNGHSWLVEEWINWFLVESQNYDEIANKIIQIDRMWLEEIRILWKNSVTKFNSEYDNDLLIDKFEKIIEIINNDNLYI